MKLQIKNKHTVAWGWDAMNKKQPANATASSAIKNVPRFVPFGLDKQSTYLNDANTNVGPHSEL